MSATNSTPNYNLPVFLATDKPAWLTDWNGAMNAIDTAIHSAQASADAAQTSAGTAIADIATINASLNTITGNITSLTTAVNGNTGSINTINSLIGNGQPTTEDKTLIGAINEIYAMIGGGTEILAENVSYDNTLSGLSAVNVQSAIDELAVGGGVSDMNVSAYNGNLTITNNTSVIEAVGLQPYARYALNANKSFGKIYGYGQVTVNMVTGDNVLFTMSHTDLPTHANDFSVDLGATMVRSGSGNVACVPSKLVFKANGTIQYVITAGGTITGYVAFISLPPCYYQLSDFGD